MDELVCMFKGGWVTNAKFDAMRNSFIIIANLPKPSIVVNSRLLSSISKLRHFSVRTVRRFLASDLSQFN